MPDKKQNKQTPDALFGTHLPTKPAGVAFYVLTDPPISSIRMSFN